MADPTMWIHHAECRKHDPNLFFPDQRASHESIRGAITICLCCPVQAECAMYAKKIGAKFGIWSGVLLAVDRKERH